ncbi:MAG: hypothetical protein LBI05_12015 [Planctomycetaceae bacterium]|nr:hypothetical protein [Planctomycetaceae bacterium]
MPIHHTEAYAALHAYMATYERTIEYRMYNEKIIMWLSKVNVNVDTNGYPVFHGEVSWKYEPNRLDYIVNPVQWSHSMQGGQRRVAFPMFPQRHYPRPGMPFRIHPGVNWNNNESVYEGVDCLSPEWTITAKQQLISSLITNNYLTMLYSMAKTTNSTIFMGFAPGTMLYVGAELDENTKTVNEWDFNVTNITHKFIYEPNMENFNYDGIPVAFKGGHEYLWLSTAVASEEGEQAQTVVTQVNVAQMYGVSNFNFLGLSNPKYNMGHVG